MLIPVFTTVVGDYMNIMKTTFDFNFDFYPVLNSMNNPKNGNKEKLQNKNVLFNYCKLVIRKKLVNN